MKKRILALITAIMMLVSMLPVSAEEAGSDMPAIQEQPSESITEDASALTENAAETPVSGEETPVAADEQPAENAEPAEETPVAAEEQPVENTEPAEETPVAAEEQPAENTEPAEETPVAAEEQPAENAEPADEAPVAADEQPVENAEPAEEDPVATADEQPIENAEPAEETPVATEEQPAENTEPAEETPDVADEQPVDTVVHFASGYVSVRSGAKIYESASEGKVKCTAASGYAWATLDKANDEDPGKDWIRLSFTDNGSSASGYTRFENVSPLSESAAEQLVAKLNAEGLTGDRPIPELTVIWPEVEVKEPETEVQEPETTENAEQPAASAESEQPEEAEQSEGSDQPEESGQPVSNEQPEESIQSEKAEQPEESGEPEISEPTESDAQPEESLLPEMLLSDSMPMMTLGSASPESCEHEFTEFRVNPENPDEHGFFCQNCNQLLSGGYEAHYKSCGDPDATVCAACGAAYNGTKIDHTLSDEGFRFNTNKHWKTCECGEETYEQPHHFYMNDQTGDICCYECGLVHVSDHHLVYSQYGTENHIIKSCAECGIEFNIQEEHQFNGGVCVKCGYDSNGCEHGLYGFVYEPNDHGGHDVFCSECHVFVREDFHYCLCTETENRNTCIYCGATGVETEPRHENTVQRFDESEHWTYCYDCGQTYNFSEHYISSDGSCWCGYLRCTWDGWNHEALCSDPDRCRYCLKTAEELGLEKLPLTHGAEEYRLCEEDASCHARYCRDCGWMLDAAPNPHERACDSTEDVCYWCGAEYHGTSVRHQFVDYDVLESDPEGHWRACANCDARIDEEEHQYTFDGIGYVCDVCQYRFPYATSGTDDTVTWNFNLQTGELSFSGGAIPDHAAEERPWNGLRGLVASVTLAADVSAVGENALAGMDGLNRVEFQQETAPDIAENAFAEDICTCVYYSDDASWSAVITSSYGGTLTWDTQAADLNYGFDPDNMMLVITGNGRIADYATPESVPWYDLLLDAEKIEIGSGIISIGSNAFAAGNPGIRVDFMGTTAPEIGVNAFPEGAHFRYYQQGGVWPDSFIYLPARYSSVKQWSNIVLEEDGHVYSEAQNQGDRVLLDSVAQGMELAEDWVTLMLYRAPSDAEIADYSREVGKISDIWIRGRYRGTFSFTVTDQCREDLYFNFQSPFAEAEIDLPDDFALYDLTVFTGKVTVNGSVRKVKLYGLDNEPTDSSVTVDGDVELLEWTAPGCTSQNPYLGSLTVNGTVQKCLIKNDQHLTIPCDDGTSFDFVYSSQTQSCTGLTGEIITAGVLNPEIIPEEIPVTMDDLSLEYMFCFDENGKEDWVLYPYKKSGEALSSSGGTLKRWNEETGGYDGYCPDFTGAKLYAGPDTILSVSDYGDHVLTIPKLSGPIGQFVSSSGNATVNCDVERVWICENLERGTGKVTLGGTVGMLSISGTNPERVIEIAEGGTVTEGEYSRGIGIRTFGSVSGETVLFANGALTVMSYGEGDTIGAIIPADSVITGAADLADGHTAAMDVHDSILNEAEQYALEGMLGADTVAAVVDISVTELDDSGVTVGSVTELNGEIQVTLSAPDGDPDAEYYVIRLHENDDGTIAMDTVCEVTSGDLAVHTDQFSKYAIIRKNVSAFSDMDPDRVIIDDSLIHVTKTYDENNILTLVVDDDLTDWEKVLRQQPSSTELSFWMTAENPDPEKYDQVAMFSKELSVPEANILADLNSAMMDEGYDCSPEQFGYMEGAGEPVLEQSLLIPKNDGTDRPLGIVVRWFNKETKEYLDERLQYRVISSRTDAFAIPVRMAPEEWLNATTAELEGMPCDVRVDTETGHLTLTLLEDADIKEQAFPILLNAPEGAATLEYNGGMGWNGSADVSDGTAGWLHDSWWNGTPGHVEEDTVALIWKDAEGQILDWGIALLDFVPYDSRPWPAFEGWTPVPEDRFEMTNLVNVQKTGVQPEYSDGILHVSYNAVSSVPDDAESQLRITVLPPEGAVYYKLHTTGSNTIFGQDSYMVQTALTEIDRQPLTSVSDFCFGYDLLREEHFGGLTVYVQGYSVSPYGGFVIPVFWYDGNGDQIGSPEYFCLTMDEFSATRTTQTVSLAEIDEMSAVSDITAVTEQSGWTLEIESVPSNGNGQYYDLKMLNERGLRVDLSDPTDFYLPYPDGYSRADYPEDAFVLRHYYERTDPDASFELKEQLTLTATEQGLKFTTSSLSPFVLSENCCEHDMTETVCEFIGETTVTGRNETQHELTGTWRETDICQDCGETVGERITENYTTWENHIYGPDDIGICIVCGAVDEYQTVNDCGDYGWTVSDDGTTLTVTGTAIPDFVDGNDAPWASSGESAAKITRVIISGTVESVGDYAFAALPSLRKVDLMESACPRIGTDTFGDATVRYYRQGDGWPETFIYLPVFNPGGSANIRVEKNGRVWFYINGDSWGYITYDQLWEELDDSTYAVKFKGSPSDNRFLPALTASNRIIAIFYSGDVTGDWTLDYDYQKDGDNPTVYVYTNANDFNLTVNAEEEPVYMMVVENGHVTVNGSVNQIQLYGEAQDNSDSTVYITGDVETMSWYDRTTGLTMMKPYLGTVTVDGTVRQGYYHTRTTLSIPNLENIQMDLSIGSFEDATGLIIDHGELTAPHDDPYLDTGEMTLYYYLSTAMGEPCWEINIWLPGDLVNTTFPIRGYHSDDTVENLRPDFDVSMIAWGERTSLYVHDTDFCQGETLVIPGDGDPDTLDLFNFMMDHGTVELRAESDTASVECNTPRSMGSNPGVLTVNAKVRALVLKGKCRNRTVITGNNGSIETGYLYPDSTGTDLLNARYFGAIGANATVLDNARLCVMSYVGDDAIGSILPAEGSMSAYGLAEGETVGMDIRQNREELSDEETDALHGLDVIPENAEVVAVMDINLYTYDMNDSIVKDMGELTMLTDDARFTFSAPEDATDDTAYTVVNLHNGTATVVGNSTGTENIEISSDRFSKFAIVDTSSGTGCPHESTYTTVEWRSDTTLLSCDEDAHTLRGDAIVTAYCEDCGNIVSGPEEILSYEAVLPHEYSTCGICPICGRIQSEESVMNEWDYQWTVADKTLTVTGELIPDFDDPLKAPWMDVAEPIRRVVISSKVEKIGKNAFAGLTDLEMVDLLEEECPEIGENAFGDAAVRCYHVADSWKDTGYVYLPIFYGGWDAQIESDEDGTLFVSLANGARYALTPDQTLEYTRGRSVTLYITGSPVSQAWLDAITSTRAITLIRYIRDARGSHTLNLTASTAAEIEIDVDVNDGDQFTLEVNTDQPDCGLVLQNGHVTVNGDVKRITLSGGDREQVENGNATLTVNGDVNLLEWTAPGSKNAYNGTVTVTEGVVSEGRITEKTSVTIRNLGEIQLELPDRIFREENGEMIKDGVLRVDIETEGLEIDPDKLTVEYEVDSANKPYEWTLFIGASEGGVTYGWPIRKYQPWNDEWVGLKPDFDISMIDWGENVILSVRSTDWAEDGTLVIPGDGDPDTVDLGTLYVSAGMVVLNAETDRVSVNGEASWQNDSTVDLTVNAAINSLDFFNVFRKKTVRVGDGGSIRSGGGMLYEDERNNRNFRSVEAGTTVMENGHLEVMSYFGEDDIGAILPEEGSMTAEGLAEGEIIGMNIRQTVEELTEEALDLMYSQQLVPENSKIVAIMDVNLYTYDEKGRIVKDIGKLKDLEDDAEFFFSVPPKTLADTEYTVVDVHDGIPTVVGNSTGLENIRITSCEFSKFAIIRTSPEKPVFTLTPPSDGTGAYYTGELVTATLTIPGGGYENAAICFKGEGMDWEDEFWFDEAWEDGSYGEMEFHVPAVAGYYDVYVIARPEGESETVTLKELERNYRITSQGPVGEMNADVPRGFRPEEGLDITLHTAENAAWYTWILYNEYGDAILSYKGDTKDGVLWNENFDENGDYVFNIPNEWIEGEARFKLGSGYSFEVIYGQDGWDRRDDWFTVFAMDEPTLEMKARLGDSDWATGITDVRVNEYFELQVSAPGAYHIRIQELSRGDWDGRDVGYDESFNPIIMTESINEGNATYSFVAVAYYDDDTVCFSNWCDVTVLPAESEAKAPSVSLNSSTVKRGEFLEVTVTPDTAVPYDVQNLRYSLRILDGEQAWTALYEDYRDQMSVDEFVWRVPTSMLENDHEYQLRVSTVWDGALWAEDTVTGFRVSEEDDEDQLILPTGRITTGEEFRFELSMLYDEAPNVRILATDRDGQTEEWYFDHWDGHYGNGGRRYDETHSFDLNVQKWIPEYMDNGEIDWLQDGIWVPLGLIGYLDIDADEQLDNVTVVSSPALKTTDGFVVAFALPADVEYGSAWVCGWNGEVQWDASMTDADTGLVTLCLDSLIREELDENGNLIPGSKYDFTVKACAPGFNASHTNGTVTVLGTDEEEHSVSLSVDKTELLSREEFTWTVSAPDATFVKLVWSGSRTDNRHLWLDNDSNHASYDRYTDTDSVESGTALLWALAYYGETAEDDNPDDYVYSAVSEPVTVTATESGILPNGPAYEIVGLDEDYRITLGQMLSVTVTPDQENTDPERTLTYEVTIREKAEEWEETAIYRSEERTGKDAFAVTVPTISLDPEKEYYFEIGVWGLGCDWRGSNTRERLTFTVTEPEEGESVDFARLMDPPEKYLTGDTVMVNVQTRQEYNRIRLAIVNTEDSNDRWNCDFGWDGHYGEFDFTLPDHSGTYEVTVYGETEEGWTDEPLFSDPLTVSAELLSEDAVLDRPMLEVSPVIFWNEDDLVVMFREVDHAEQYQLSVHPDGGEDFLWIEGEAIPQPENGVITVFITCDEEAGFELNGQYMVHVLARAKGYEATWSNDYPFLLAEPEDEPRVTLSVDTETLDVNTGDFIFTYSAPEADRAEWFVIREDGCKWNDTLNTEETDFSFWNNEPGRYQAYVKAIYVEDGKETVSVSNIVAFESRSVGSAAMPTVSIPDTAVLGTQMEIGVIPGEGTPADVVFRYELQIALDHGEGDDWEGAYYAAVSEEGNGSLSFSIPVDALKDAEAGQKYKAHIDVSAPGYVMASTENVIFEVTKPEEFTEGIELPESVRVYQDVYVTVRKLDAEAARVWVPDGDDRTLFGQPEAELINGVAVIHFDYHFETSGIYQVWVETRGEDEDTWVRMTGEPLELTVTSDGELAEPVITAPDNVQPGKDLVYSFTAVENATQYDVWIGKDGQDDPILHENQTPGEHTVTSDLLPEGQYWINVFVKADNMDASSATVNFTVCGHEDLENVPENAVTCTEDGNEEYWICNDCGRFFMMEDDELIEVKEDDWVIEAKGHTWSELIAKVEPTCTETGLKAHYRCTACDGWFDEEKEETTEAALTIAMLGHDEVDHDAQAPTCTEIGWDAYQTCSRCDYTTYAEKAALGHDCVDHAAQAPTCTEIGWDAYQTCSRCDYTTYAEQAALGHDYVNHAAQAPTCTEIGWDAYQTCSRCDYTTYEEKAALGHAYVDHTAQEPTCTGIGWDAYQTCSRCDYTTYAEKVALGHDYVNHDAQAPTCTAIGWDAYQTCNRCEYTSYAEKAALGHDYVNHDAQAPTCTAIGWDAYQTCSRCEYTSYAEQAALGHDYVNHDAQAPTCTEIGWDAYRTCSRCEYTEGYTEYVALGHVYVNHAAQEPTCTEIGWDAYQTCSRCDYTTYVEKAALGHKLDSEIPEIPKTCTKEGYKAYWVCDICGKSFTDNTGTTELAEDDRIIPASHEWVDATCTAPKTCSACGATEGNALGHDYVDHVAQEPTCTAIGWDAYQTCSRCDYTTYVEQAALGHDYVDHAAQTPTCTAIGWDAYQTCSRCDYTSYTEIAMLSHDWAVATCIAPKTCKVCQATEGKANGHDWAEATCIAPKTCKVCQATEGKANGHDWAAATCTAPKTCKVCQATEGKANGHDWAAATCTAPKTCKVCQATEGKANGHDWADATCTAPKTCKVCQATEGKANGHDWVTVPGKPATETETGLTDGVACSVCGAVQKAQEVIDILPPSDPVEAFVKRAYSLILGRGADPEGLQAWTEALKSGAAAGGDIIYGFINSPEFLNAGKGIEEQVEIMYNVMLGRPSDPAGKASWIQALKDGADINTIAAGFVGSTEFIGICNGYGIAAGSIPTPNGNGNNGPKYNTPIEEFVGRCYSEALGRGADPSGLSAWATIIMNREATPQQVAQGFVFSPEVELKNLSNGDFVEMLYRLYMGRGADPSGKAAWTQALDEGASRETVSEGFANSIEFGLIVASYGL